MSNKIYIFESKRRPDNFETTVYMELEPDRKTGFHDVPDFIETLYDILDDMFHDFSDIRIFSENEDGDFIDITDCMEIIDSFYDREVRIQFAITGQTTWKKMYRFLDYLTGYGKPGKLRAGEICFTDYRNNHIEEVILWSDDNIACVETPDYIQARQENCIRTASLSFALDEIRNRFCKRLK